MSDVKLSVVIGGLGMPCLNDCLNSWEPLPDDLVVAIDIVGRSQAMLDYEVLDSIPAMNKPYVLVKNQHFDDWDMTNQTLNIGVAAASGRWILCTHEDTLWNGYPFIAEYARVIDVLESQECKIDGHEIVSVYFPFEQRGGGAHEPGKDVPTLGACYSAVSSIIRRDWWEAIGKFDQTHGMFYDYHVTAEMVKQGVFGYVHPLPGPLPYHERSVNYVAISSSPKRMDPGMMYERYDKKWGRLHDVFPQVYGEGLAWHTWIPMHEKRYTCQRL